MAPNLEGVETRPEGANVAFLLVHGFCAAPNELATLGQFLEERNIASFAVPKGVFQKKIAINLALLFIKFYIFEN